MDGGLQPQPEPISMAAPRNENIRSIILEATQSLLDKKMLSDISLAEIAAQAGVSKGTLYYYYKTKNDILFDLTDAYLTKQWNDLIAWTENPDKDTSLHRLVKYVIERNISTPPFRIHLLCDAITGNEDIRQKLIARYSDFEKLIAEKLSERTDALPAGFFSWLILFVSDGLFLQRLLENPNVDIDEFIELTVKYIRLLVRGGSAKG